MDTSTVMMALGDYRFSITTAAYQQMVRKNEWRWPEIERIGQRPARQFIGPGSETISLSGKIYPNFKPQNAGLAQMPQLRDTADTGEPLQMVDGLGRIWGNYGILSIEETSSVFFADGTPRCVEFQMELGAIGD